MLAKKRTTIILAAPIVALAFHVELCQNAR